MSEFVFIAVKESSSGDLEMTIGDKEFNGPCLVLNCTVIHIDTKQTVDITLVVPRSQGSSLIRALLTEDQWDAVLDA